MYLKKLYFIIYKKIFINNFKDITGILTDEKTESYINYEKTLQRKQKIFESKLKDLIYDVDYSICYDVNNGNLSTQCSLSSSRQDLIEMNDCKKQLKEYYIYILG